MSSWLWTSARSGNWSDDKLWTPDSLPGIDDDVEIDASGKPFVVTIDSNVSVHSLTVAGDDATVSLQGATFIAGAYDNGAGSTLLGNGDVAAVFSNEGAVVAEGGTLEFTVAGDVFAGSLGGTGTLEILANATLDAASVSVANLVVQGAGVIVSADDDFTISSQLQLGAGASLAIGGDVNVSGVDSFSGDVGGAGALDVVGGVSAFHPGATLGVDELLQSGGTIALGESLTFSGAVQQNSGVISLGLDDVLTLDGAVTLNGAVTGLGALTFTGSGATTFGAATLTIGAIVIDGDATLNFDDDVTYAGTLDQRSGAIVIGAATLTLSGADTLAGSVTGGTLDIAGGVTTVASTGSLSVDDEIVGVGAVLAIASTAGQTFASTSNAGLILVETNGGGNFGVSFDDDFTQAATGIVEIANGASVEFDVNPRGGTIAFGPGVDELLAVNGASLGAGRTVFGARIENFGVGDTIEIVGATEISMTETRSGADTLIDMFTTEGEIVFTLLGRYEQDQIQFRNANGDDDVLLTVAPVDKRPVLSRVSAKARYEEMGAAVTVDPHMLVGPRAAEISRARVRIAHGFRRGDTLTWTNEGGVVGTYDGSTGVLTLTGDASAATYTAIFDSIAFFSTSANATKNGKDTRRTLIFTAVSGSLVSVTAKTKVDVFAPRPILAITSSDATFTEGGSSVDVDANVSISTSAAKNASGAKVAIGKGFMAGDRLSFVAEFGIQGVYDAASGVLILTGAASLADFQTVLESVMFSSTSLNPTDYGTDLTRELVWTVRAGGAKSHPVTTTVGVVGVDAAPILVHGGVMDKYSLGAAAVVVDAAIKAKDVDNLDLASATIVISGGYHNGDILGYSTALAEKYGLSAAFDSANGALTFIGSASLKHYDLILESVTFASNSPTAGARTLTWTVSDGTKTSAATTTTIDAVPAASSFDFAVASGLITGAASSAETSLLLWMPNSQGGWLAGSFA